MNNFPGYEQLNEQERSFVGCLSAVDKDSIWGIAINNVMTAPDAHKYRTLICDLKAQADDCADIMLSILGKSCFDQLQKL